MADSVSMTIDTRSAVRSLRKLGKRAQDPRKAFGAFHGAWNMRVALEWNRTKIGESTRFRGEEDWPALKPQYVRADGTAIPVTGKVPKVHGRGKVQAKLKGRKTGKGGGRRYRAADKMMIFTARLRRWWLSRRHVFEGKTRLVIGKGDAPIYAAPQNALRRFAFFKTPDDPRLLKAHFLRWIRSDLVRKFGSSRG